MDITQFLRNRQQYATIDGFHSVLRAVISGEWCPTEIDNWPCLIPHLYQRLFCGFSTRRCAIDTRLSTQICYLWWYYYSSPQLCRYNNVIKWLSTRNNFNLWHIKHREPITLTGLVSQLYLLLPQSKTLESTFQLIKSGLSSFNKQWTVLTKWSTGCQV